MKRKLLWGIVWIFTASSAFAITGREIMERNDALPSSKASFQNSILAIQKGSHKEIKKLESISKKYGKDTRTKMTFTSPTRLGFLVYDYAGKDSVQWIKLSSGKVRKIASSEKGKPWMNSHFYNEDIGDKDIDNYSYKYLGEGKVGNYSVYKVEAIKKSKNRVYSKAIFYIDKSNYLQRKVDFYQNGRHIKTLTFDMYEKISGIWTPRKLKMERTDGKGMSLLYVKSVKHNINVLDSQLKKEAF